MKNFFEAPEFDLILDEFLIKIRSKKSGKEVVSTLFNTIYYIPSEETMRPRRVKGASRLPEQDFKDPELFEAQGV